MSCRSVSLHASVEDKPEMSVDENDPSIEKDKNGAPVIGEITIQVKLDHALGQVMTNVARFKFADTTLMAYDDDDEEVGRIGSTIGSEIEVAFSKPASVFAGRLEEEDFGTYEQYLLHSPDIYNAVVDLVSKPEVRKKIKQLVAIREKEENKRFDESQRAELLKQLRDVRKQRAELDND